MHGGVVACSHCGGQVTLPDRGALVANPGVLAAPSNDPHRLQQLRAQDGRSRVVSPGLVALLGGSPRVLPGREREALAIWQSLRARSAAGDVTASEDMATLVLLLSEVPAVYQNGELGDALAESTFDAAVLPRHKQEQLGRLTRRAVARGDREAARRYLTWMAADPAELESDSELRVSAAFLATLEGAADRVIALVGARKDEVPIADPLDPLASVVRANAHEQRGDLRAAQSVLGELSAPSDLDRVRERFAALSLCERSGTAYASAWNLAAARRAAASARGLGRVVGVMLGLVGAMEIAIGLAVARATGKLMPGGGINVIIGGVMIAIGLVLALRASSKARRAAWLRIHGRSLAARVVDAQVTGMRVNNVPVYRLGLDVADPNGPYRATIRKLLLEHEVTLLLGREVRVRVDPARRDDLILEV